MATLEFEKRMERRRRQRWWEELNRQPEVMVLRREIARRARYQRRHPFSGQSASIRGLLYMHCVYMGIRFGGRARKARRCTKQLGSRLCWNWRVSGTDRCYRHGRP
jgi:hypothetical protein